MASSPSYGDRPPLQGFRRSFTVPHRQLSHHERAGLSNADADSDILYTHSSVKVVGFSPPLESNVSKSSATNADADYPIDTVGTLPWRSRTEDPLASGRMVIEKVRGSSWFLKCPGTQFVHPILRNSQCWCVDGESKFVMRKGRFQYYRIELPATTDEEKRKVEELKVALPKVLKFEKTPCPFKRGFHVDLPDDAITPRRKGKWQKPEGSLPGTPDTDTPTLRRTKGARSLSMQAQSPVPVPESRRQTDYGFAHRLYPTPPQRRNAAGLRITTPSSTASNGEIASQDLQEDYSDSGSSMDGFRSGQKEQLPVETTALSVGTQDQDTEPGESSSEEKPVVEDISQPTPPESPAGPEPETEDTQEDLLPQPAVQESSEKELPPGEAVNVQVEPAPVETAEDGFAEEFTGDEPAAEMPTQEEEPIQQAPPSPKEVLDQDVPRQQAPPSPEEVLDQEDAPIQQAPPSPEEVLDQEETRQEQSLNEDRSLPADDSEHEAVQPERQPEESIQPSTAVPEFDSTSEVLENPTVETSSHVEDEPKPSDEDQLKPSDEDQLKPSDEDQPKPSDEDQPKQSDGASEVDRTQATEKAEPPVEPIPAEDGPNDTPSIDSTTGSFHTLTSEDQEQGQSGIFLQAPSEASPPAEPLDPINIRQVQHRRGVSELTITASNFDDQAEHEQLDRFITSEETAERPNTPRLIKSSASDESWPDVSTPASSIQFGLRQRLKSRRSLSPMPSSSNGLTPQAQNHGSHMTSVLLQKACNLALLKPIEVVVFFVQILARIAGGASLNDLLTGELFKRPDQHRRNSSFPDRISPQQDDEEDDFGVPIRGRTRSSETNASNAGHDTDADSLFDLD